MDKQTALEHAAQVVGEACAENLLFRCGPCDICGGACFCRPNDELVERLLTGLKPVGTFCYGRKVWAIEMQK